MGHLTSGLAPTRVPPFLATLLRLAPLGFPENEQKFSLVMASDLQE
jgi:hypothetical protein